MSIRVRNNDSITRTRKQRAVGLHGFKRPPPSLFNLGTKLPLPRTHKRLTGVRHRPAARTPLLRLPPQSHAEPSHVGGSVGARVRLPFTPVCKGKAPTAAGFAFEAVQREERGEVVLVAVTRPPAGICCV